MASEVLAGRVRRGVRFAVIASIVWVGGLGAFALFYGEDLLRSWARAGWPLIVATLVAFIINHAIRFVRWHWMLRALGASVPILPDMSIFMAGLALLPTPGKAGVAVRSVLLARLGVPVRASLAAYLAERLFDLVGLLLLAGAFYRGLYSTQIVVTASIGVGMVIGLVYFQAPVLRLLMRMVGAYPLAAAGIDGLAGLLEDAANLFRWQRAVAFLGLGMLANGTLAALITVVCERLSANVPLNAAFGYIAIAHLSGSMSMLPGGLGPFELALLAGLAQSNVSAANALVVVTCVRFVTLWGAVAVGLPLLIAMFKPWRKRA